MKLEGWKFGSGVIHMAQTWSGLPVQLFKDCPASVRSCLFIILLLSMLCTHIGIDRDELYYMHVFFGVEVSSVLSSIGG